MLDTINEHRDQKEHCDQNIESCESKCTKWSKLLHQYKTDLHDKNWVYMYHKLFTVVYDKYPKSVIHLLVLPLDISYVNSVGIKIEANKPYQFRYGHLKSLKLVHKECRKLCRFIEENYEGIKLKMGYHYRPTMDDLHIHLISDDFMHCKKTKKKSFSSKNFITIDDVEKSLEEYGRL
jgi:hypothetical protein